MSEQLLRFEGKDGWWKCTIDPWTTVHPQSLDETGCRWQYLHDWRSGPWGLLQHIPQGNSFYKTSRTQMEVLIWTILTSKKQMCRA